MWRTGWSFDTSTRTASTCMCARLLDVDGVGRQQPYSNEPLANLVE